MRLSEERSAAHQAKMRELREKMDVEKGAIEQLKREKVQSQTEFEALYRREKVPLVALFVACHNISAIIINR
jgi:hypothetical protein